jgi:hypothetical protein
MIRSTKGVARRGTVIACETVEQGALVSQPRERIQRRAPARRRPASHHSEQPPERRAEASVDRAGLA